MKLYKKSIRYDSLILSKYEGMDENIITELMTELGHTKIKDITEHEFKALTKDNN